jgi:hypothetical protein
MENRELLIMRDLVGGRSRARTADLLLVRQRISPKLLITEQILPCKISNFTLKIRLWVGYWVGSLAEDRTA